MLLARNTSHKFLPIKPIRGANNKASKTIPRENIRDILDKHVLLLGIAIISLGIVALDGQTTDRKEGVDLMRELDTLSIAYRG